MISYLQGKVLATNPDNVLLVNSGVGYQVLVKDALTLNQEVSLFIHPVIREDSITFIGFISQNELLLFKTLLNVNGVGPTTALTIIRNVPYPTLLEAIRDKNVALLTGFKGLSSKNALNIANLSKLPESLIKESKSIESAVIDIDCTYAIESLINLGYDGVKAKEAVEASFKEMDSQETDKLSVLVSSAIGRL